MTPAAFNAWATGYVKTLKEDEERQKAGIYNLASLIRTAVWGKRFPDYEQVFPSSKKEMSDEAMYAAVCALNAMMGGST